MEVGQRPLAETLPANAMPTHESVFQSLLSWKSVSGVLASARQPFHVGMFQSLLSWKSVNGRDPNAVCRFCRVSILVVMEVGQRLTELA